jgi:hypothetical protein
MPIYLIVMGAYTLLTVYILYLVISNMFQSKNIWDQLLAVLVIIPFLLRLFFIK